MTTKFFGLIVVLALAIASSTFAQNLRQADLAKVQTMRSAMHYMHGGAVANDTAGSTTVQQAGGKILIWSDRKYYLPGEDIKIRALGLAADATGLQFFITEIFTDTQGNTFSQPQYVCECGDSNGGFVPSLVNYNFITLVNKKTPQNIGGKYSFTIVAYRYAGNGQAGAWYQQTTLTVLIGINSNPEANPIRIDSMTQGAGAGPILFLTGIFPPNTPMYYFTGAAPYEGGFSDYPEVVSTDGYTLVLPGIYAGTGMEARVVLMLPDGSFSTTSPQTFVPLPGQSQH